MIKLNTQDLKSLSKAIGQGLVVTILGIWLPIILLVVLPGAWTIVGWLIFLVIFVLITSGRVGWQSTASARRQRFRLGQTNRTKLLLGSVLALLFVVIGQSLLMITFRLVPYPHDLFVAGTNYDELTTLEIWLSILIAAAGAGIYEEIGFRGYMQVPLEEKYGIVKANAVVSLVFMLLHLNQLWAPAILLQLFVLSILFGIIAYVSRSLLPGIFGHILIDIFNFGYWWSDFFGVYDHTTIFESSTDLHFWAWSMVLVVSTLVFIYVTRFTLSLDKQEAKSLPHTTVMGVTHSSV